MGAASEHETLHYIDGLIQRSLSSLHLPDNPIVRQRIRLRVLQNLGQYDPKRGSLSTFIQPFVQEAVRNYSKMTQPFVVPEYYQRMFREIQSAEQEFRTVYQRDPSDEELSRLTQIPVKRLQKIKQRIKRVTPVSTFEVDDEDDESSPQDSLAVHSRDPYEDWADAVYAELSDVDKLIMQHSTGYQGAEILDNTTLAQKTGLDPAMVSKKKQFILARLNEFYQ